MKDCAGSLPHMRFLLADKQMLEMTFILLISGPRVGSNITQAEKNKIEECFEIFIKQFFKLDHDFKELKNASRQLNFLREDEIGLLTKKPVDYYRAKRKENFKFRTWDGQDEDEEEDLPDSNLLQVKKGFSSPTKLELPFVKDE